MAVQADMGRFLPLGAALKAPLYYSFSTEKTSPKYNPLDSDVLLKDALDEAGSRQERDSIKSMAVERLKVTSFSISGLNFGVRSRNPSLGIPPTSLSATRSTSSRAPIPPPTTSTPTITAVRSSIPTPP